MYATGRRKTSIAKIWLKKGTGKIFVNGKNFQVVISDTPGFTIPKNKIHEYMNKKILSSFKDDHSLFVLGTTVIPAR